jgi:hypothetical protein
MKIKLVFKDNGNCMIFNFINMLYLQNQEGLVYVDVDFAKQPANTQGKPVVHGEEDRTEYTFVDFSKKAPPMPETQDEED